MVGLDLSNRRTPYAPIDLWEPCLLLHLTGEGSPAYADLWKDRRGIRPFLSMAESHGLVM